MTHLGQRVHRWGALAQAHALQRRSKGSLACRLVRSWHANSGGSRGYSPLPACPWVGSPLLSACTAAPQSEPPCRRAGAQKGPLCTDGSAAAALLL